jgi:hypothetical protein
MEYSVVPQLKKKIKKKEKRREERRNVRTYRKLQTARSHVLALSSYLWALAATSKESNSSSISKKKKK